MVVVNSHQRAFTLIEVLVVISIIAVLAALLVPTTKMVGDMARRNRCGSNLRQMQWGIQSYVMDWEGCYPNSTTNTPSWRSKISSYYDTIANGSGSANARDVFGCPEARRQKKTLVINQTYSMNINISPITTSVVGINNMRKFTQVLLVSDGDFLDTVSGGAVNMRWREVVGTNSASVDLVPSSDQTQDLVPDAPHANSTKSNLVFIDGHLECWQLDDIPLQAASPPGSVFWRFLY